VKLATPIITLIAGLALALSLLFYDMTQVSATNAAYGAASPSPVGVASTVTGPATGSPAQPTSATVSPASTVSPATTVSPAATPAPVASVSAGASGFVIPPHANYTGEVKGNLGAIAIAVHETFAIAYFCNGGTQEAWLKGTPDGGKLSMKGTGSDASLTANYALGHIRGTVVVNGISYVFSVIAVHRPSGLFESIADVRGAVIKAGWIVLSNGTVVGSMTPNLNAAHPVSQAAPKLDLSSLTAPYEGTTLKVTPVDGETGSGF
jgi:hypothetical protein